MNTSYKVVELVKRRIGTEYLKASDADVAKVLGISRTSVSNYKAGRDVMGQETLLKAQGILELELPQLITYALDLQIDANKHDGQRNILRAMRDVAAKFTTKSAGILLAGFVALGGPHDAQALENKGFALPYPAEATSPSLYIMVNKTCTEDRSSRTRSEARLQRVK